MLKPFINHIATAPEMCRHRISLLPSPLKSPVPAICQSFPGVPTKALDWMLKPFINHIATAPEMCRHRISLLPSPLKSPVPAICQSLSAVPKSSAAPVAQLPEVAPVIS